jgi:hypothetical protein
VSGLRVRWWPRRGVSRWRVDGDRGLLAVRSIGARWTKGCPSRRLVANSGNACSRKRIQGLGLISIHNKIRTLILSPIALAAMLGRLIQGLGWVAVIPLLATHLSAAELGFYYTFGSLAALQVFVELGLTGVVVQSLAHEVAHLHFGKSGAVWLWEGPFGHKSRMMAILHFVQWWFGIAGSVAIIALGAGGLWFMHTVEREHVTGVEWLHPWLAMAVLSGGVVWSAGVMSVLEGMGRIGQVTMIRLIAAMIGLLALSVSLLLGAGLWSAVIGQGSVMLVGLVTGLCYLWRPWQAMRGTARDPAYRWRTEIWPFQWRIALSWMCGWLIFQAMTPAMLRVSGAEAAGRFGVALQIANGIQTIALVWVQLRVPTWGMMVAHADWTSLDRDFWKTVFISIACSVIGVFLLAICIVYQQKHHLDFTSRVPPLLTLIPLLGVAVVNQWIFATAAYLRAHKREPFLIVSILAAACMLLAMQIPWLVRESTLAWVYAAVSVGLGGIWGTLIWYRCRGSWHVCPDSKSPEP